MSNYTQCGNLSVANELFHFVNDEVLKDSSVTPDAFWAGFDTSIHELAPRNRALLEVRQSMQNQIDDWLQANAKGGIDQSAYEAFLTDIGYLLE